MEKIAIIGASTNAKVIYNFILHYKLFDVVCFAVDKKYIVGDSFHGKPLVSICELHKHIDKEKDKVFIGVQWNRLNKDRRMLFEKMKLLGYKFANVISPSAIIHENVKLGNNIWIADNVVIETNCIIENNTFIKTGAIIGGSTVVHNHCFIGIKALIAGGCIIGEQSFVGINATIFDMVTIGEKCIIGATTIIKRNLPSYSMVINRIENQRIDQLEADSIEERLLAKKNIR